ncbi:N-acetylneuraminic acid mutarotase [Pedobacter sp. AK017]|uniref:Kelch repeat-containing protein n=1 Tax=Pedobacter sp. AK017 TaxID=2723073 RepID=UPI0016146CA8|nr:galactose oxidase [Pedobacter sp. AK017]MBB5440739.1 N-acetylneuraminic acid mutarotase [Pedobacter sp. AK017]
MNKPVYLFLLLILMSTMLSRGVAQTAKSDSGWSELPPIPDPIGFAGSFAGVSNGTLLVAGGANFPDGGAPWTGSKKAWHDHIFALQKPDGKWKLVGKLPHSLGYGLSITWKDSFIIIGGSNEKGHYADVSMLKFNKDKLSITTLPVLPKPIANTSGVLLGNTIYIAGGIESPDAQNAGDNFWAMDLSAKNMAWKKLETWPGPARMFAVAGALDGKFYLFSGAELVHGVRNYLKDAYQYSPKTGWKKIADLPSAVTAAPGTAYATENSLRIFGGDDGKAAADAALPREKHPGFSKQVLSYSPLTNTWSVADQIPAPAPVTTTLTIWNGNVVIPGGEVKPAVRTPKVLMYKTIKH